MSAAPGAFSNRHSQIPRSRTPPASVGLRRTLSNASSSRSSVIAVGLGRTSTAKPLSTQQQQQHQLDTSALSASQSLSASEVGGSRYSPGAAAAAASDARSVASTAQRTGAAQQHSHPQYGQFGGVPAYKNRNMTSRVFLPGEEEVVMNSKVVDVAIAAADIDLLENDLGRSSLMMPKAVRQKMLAMRKDLFPETEALLAGAGVLPPSSAESGGAGNSPNGGGSAKKSGKSGGGSDPYFGAGSAGVRADAAPIGPDQPPPLPRGSQLLKRLQASVDRSAALLGELEKRGSSCNSMLDQLLLHGGGGAKHKRDSPAVASASATNAADRSRRGSVAARPATASSPSPQQPAKGAVVELTPSPAARQQRRDEHQPRNLDDTFANLTPAVGAAGLGDTFASLSRDDSPPSASPKRPGPGGVSLDDTFAGITL